jgi:molybdate transport system substrate-binding protein
MRKTLVALAMAVVPLVFAGSASAADLRLFGGGHFQGAGEPLAEAFERKTGIASTYTPGNTGNGGINRRIAAGEVMDIIVMNRAELDEQVRMGVIKADSVVTFAEDRMGLAVPKGAPKVDISTPDKLRAALRSARAVMTRRVEPDGNSGKNIQTILTNLGIADEVNRKAVISDDRAPIIEKRVDIGFWSYPELLRQTEVDVLGPAPGELGGFTHQAIGILSTNRENDAKAREFIKFITSPEGAAVFRQHGLEPLTPGARAN